jgi:hypothetical protein
LITEDIKPESEKPQSFFKDSDLAQLYSTPNPRQIGAKKPISSVKKSDPSARLTGRSCGNVKSRLPH